MFALREKRQLGFYRGALRTLRVARQRGDGGNAITAGGAASVPLTAPFAMCVPSIAQTPLDNAGWRRAT